MSAPAVTPAQIRAIHAIKARTRLDEGSYRAMLAAYGAASSRDLSSDEADRLLARLRDIPGASSPVHATAQGAYGRKLQALWIALYNLDAVQDRSDRAMHAFLERQTGLSHTRFLREAKAASQAIEALKAWLAREGAAGPGNLLADKRALLRAQWLRLIALGAVKPFGDPAECDGLTEYVSAKVRGAPRRLGALDDPSLTAADLDKAARYLGAWIRRARPIGERRHAG